MVVSTASTPAVADGDVEMTTSTYEDMVAKIKAYVLDNQPRPSTRGIELTKNEKVNLVKFQRELVKGLSDADKAAFRLREATVRAERKATAKPQPIRLDPTWLKELSAQVRTLQEALKAKKRPVIGGVELTHTAAFELIAGSIDAVVANPPRTTRQAAPGEDAPHTVIRFRTSGEGDPFNYGRYTDKGKAERAAKAFVKRLETMGPDMAAEFEFKVLSVAEAETAGYTIPEKVAA